MVSHLEIINPVYCDETKTFPKFGSLPAELRLEIWEQSLRYPRLIHIRLGPSKTPEQSGEKEVRYQTRNGLGKIISGKPYQVNVRNSQLQSKLLRVNNEARKAALSFYRVHIHNVVGPGRDKQPCMTLHLNPEYDILSIRPGRNTRDYVHFIHDLRAYDPLNIGLLNLALEKNDLANLIWMDTKPLGPPAWSAFTETLANLQQVFFLCAEPSGRIFFGPRGGVHTVNRFEIHRSRPVMSTVATFERIARDPRDGIVTDLSRVFVGTFDPRQMICRWRKLLDRWQIQYPPPAGPDYRFMVSTYRTGRRGDEDIVDRESAADWLQREDAHWNIGIERRASLLLKWEGKTQVETPEEIKQAPKPAVGWWLFPIEALGPIPGPEHLGTHHDNGSVWKSAQVMDMREYWPELCLTNLQY